MCIADTRYGPTRKENRSRCHNIELSLFTQTACQANRKTNRVSRRFREHAQSHSAASRRDPPAHFSDILAIQDQGRGADETKS